MAVASDAKNLQIDAAGRFDGALVLLAVCGIVFSKAAGWNVNFICGEIYFGEKIGVHEVVKALRVVGCEAKVLVEIERSGLRKIKAR